MNFFTMNKNLLFTLADESETLITGSFFLKSQTTHLAGKVEAKICSTVSRNTI